MVLPGHVDTSASAGATGKAVFRLRMPWAWLPRCRVLDAGTGKTCRMRDTAREDDSADADGRRGEPLQSGFHQCHWSQLARDHGHGAVVCARGRGRCSLGARRYPCHGPSFPGYKITCMQTRAQLRRHCVAPRVLRHVRPFLLPHGAAGCAPRGLRPSSPLLLLLHCMPFHAHLCCLDLPGSQR